MSAALRNHPEGNPALVDLLAKSALHGKHLLRIEQVGLAELDQLLAVAHKMRIATERKQVLKILEGQVLGEIFYEPSTRTSASFDAAMKRVGGQTIVLNESHSSTKKGESLEDTIRTIAQYADAIVLRHPDENSIDIAANVSSVPIINAGNGAKEHPTQALLDLLTIKEELGSLHDLTVTFVGDLKYGRTVHSLCKLLRHYNMTINLCSPASLELPRELVEQIRNREQLGIVSERLSTEIVKHSDVIYCTRVQKERFTDLEYYESVKDSLTVDSNVMKDAKEEMVLMHPLPRNQEVSTDMDSDPRAAYFRQVSF